MTEEQVFLAALDVPDQAARIAYLDEVCGQNSQLRHQVEELLAAHERSGQFLDEPAAEQMAAGPQLLAGQTVALNAEGDGALADNKKTNSSPRDEAAENLQFLSPSTRPDSLGRLGHYEMLQVLGRGGFGIVFRAFDDVLQRVVAVKVMAPQIATLSPARKRFLREARSSAAVRHENVVHVYEVGEQPLPYLVMEFVPGETLQQKLDRTGPLEVSEVLRIGRQIAEGLAAAHACDLIHRDIKPGNILLEGGSHKVKITDFGLARAADDASISQSGVIAGTPMYMAPEQALGQSIDQRADLFSLGSVLYQMVSGRPPFRASSALAVLKRVAEEPPRPIQEIIPETPTWLCDIIAKLHAKNPDDRYQSAREVADVLADCEAQLKANAKLKDYSRIPPSRQPAAGKSGRWKWAAAAALLLLAVALALTELAGVTHLFRGRAALDNVPATEQTPATPITDPDRRAAEYVLSHGGVVKVNEQEQEINAKADLPREPFRLTSAHVNFGDKQDDDGLASFKGCKNLVHLSLNALHLLNSAPYTDAGLAYFKDCKNLKSLYLGSTGVTDAGLLPFKECKDLTILSLNGSGITNAGLARVRSFNNLTHLDLANTAVTDAGLVHFKGCTNLTHLSLPWPVTDGGLVYFKDCKGLIDLNLSYARVSDAGMAAFMDCKNLKELRLDNTRVGDVGLAQFKDCKELRVLNLAVSKVTDAGMASLKNFKGLTSLALWDTRVSNAGLAFIAGLDKLTDLQLSGTLVTARGVKGLAKMLPKCTIVWDGGVFDPNFGSDRRAAEYVLSLDGGVEIDPGGEIKALVKLPKSVFRLTRVALVNNWEVRDGGLPAFKDCQKLNVLDLTGTRVTDAGLAHLTELSELKNLLLAKTRVTAKGVGELAKALPKCKITWDGGVIEPRP